MRALLLLVLVASLITAPAARAAPPAVAPVDVATRLLDALDAGRFDDASAGFTAQMRQALGTDALRGVWTSLPPPLSRGTPVVTAVGDMQLVVVPLRRQGAAVDAHVAVDREGRVAGLRITPAAAPPAPPVPADAAFTERDARIGDGDAALPGTLAMPKGEGSFPAVVLVHGSGPHDRDQSIGPNRPFLDIARGLAARGIAVLRYEKRTRHRPQDFAGDFTMDTETTDDAVAAVSALRATPGIDPARVFVLGHSQGGMLAPRIAARSGQVAGVVMLAAPARSLLDLLPEQNRFLFGLDGTLAPAELAAIARIEAQVANVRAADAQPGAETPLGLPRAYWRAFDAIDPVADARALRVPMLLLHGGRDFQVVEADWRLWRQAFADDPRATLRRFDALNHLGIAGSGPSSLDEYQTPAHVDATLIAAIADWIHAREVAPPPPRG